MSELDSSDLFQSSQTSIWMSNRSNLKTCSQKNTVSLQNVPRFQPILRCRSSTTVPLSKEKKVKFCDPPVTATYIFIRRDDDESTNSNGIESTQQTSSNIAELPRHSGNFKICYSLWHFKHFICSPKISMDVEVRTFNCTSSISFHVKKFTMKQKKDWSPFTLSLLQNYFMRLGIIM